MLVRAPLSNGRHGTFLVGPVGLREAERQAANITADPELWSAKQKASAMALKLDHEDYVAYGREQSLRAKKARKRPYNSVARKK